MATKAEMYQMGLGRELIPVTHLMAAGDKCRVETEIKECFFWHFSPTRVTHKPCVIQGAASFIKGTVSYALKCTALYGTPFLALML